MLALWKATDMQTNNVTVNAASSRDDAMVIVNQSIDRWETLIRFAAGRGGGMRNLVLFPEFNLQGFPLRESAEEWIEKACFQIPGSPEIERLQKIAQDMGIFIGANGYEAPPEWPGRYFNCSFLIDPSGDVVLKYRRVSTAQAASPHDVLDEYLDKHGIQGLWPVAKTELGNIAMMPCGEILWPDTARCLMMRGAEVILHPTSDHGRSEMMAWESAKRVRAAENMVYFISANAAAIIGPDLPTGTHAGNSKIIDYQGKLMVESGVAGESLTASAVIDMDALRRARCTPTGPFGVNRLARLRSEAYAALFNEASFYPVNLWADKPMDSKQRIQDALIDVIKRKVDDGVLVPPAKGAALEGYDLWGS
jgi:predicted amidohydrolase